MPKLTINDVLAGLDKPFTSMAEQKRALDVVARAYEKLRDSVMDRILAELPESDERHTLYWGVPSNLRYINSMEMETYAPFGFAPVEQLIELRNQVKATPIVKPERVSETQRRIAAARQSIVEEMERRKARYVEALELGRLFGGLRVTVNAHWVRNQHGTEFLRYFFYLDGRLTALQIIIAIAEQLEREKA